MGPLTLRLVCYHFLTGLAWTLSSNGGLKWVRVNVPQYRVPGETAMLQCDFDIGNDTLYAVKWYKEHEEFYRFVPKARPQANSYEVEGVQVDMTKSDRKRVVLHPVSWKTSGVFRCEVSAEAPSFSSAQSEARMEIIWKRWNPSADRPIQIWHVAVSRAAGAIAGENPGEVIERRSYQVSINDVENGSELTDTPLPQEDPVITGVEMQYQIGDFINLNCTSGKSHPASILHWYINEQQIQTPKALIYYPPTHHPMGLISSTLGLTFKLSDQHFRGGSMRVKCVASIAPILYRSDRESIVQSQNMPLREALLLGEWSIYVEKFDVKSSTNHLSAPVVSVLLAISTFLLAT